MNEVRWPDIVRTHKAKASRCSWGFFFPMTFFVHSIHLNPQDCLVESARLQQVYVKSTGISAGTEGRQQRYQHKQAGRQAYQKSFILR